MSIIHVPYQYTVEGRLKRERQMSLRTVRETIAVEIPDLSSTSIEGRVVIPHSRSWPNPDIGHPVIGGRIHAATHRAINGYRDDSAQAMTPEITARVFRDRDLREWKREKRGGHVIAPFYLLPNFGFGEEDKEVGARGAVMDTKVLVPADAEWLERGWDDREARMKEAAEVAASDTIVLDGCIHTCRREPLWMRNYVGRFTQIRSPISAIASHHFHLSIDALPDDFDRRYAPAGDVGLVVSRLPKATIALSRILQSCAQMVFPTNDTEFTFAGSGSYSRPDIHPDLDEAVRALRKVVRLIDRTVKPADSKDDLTPFATDAIVALDMWQDAIWTNGFHKGSPRHSGSVRRLLDTIPGIVAALGADATLGSDSAVDIEDDADLGVYSM
jgi:hypothetical protein